MVIPRIGQYVKVYQKPMTHEDYEGIGKIVEKPVKIWAEDGEVQVMVSFRDDAGPYSRRLCEPIEIVPEKLAGF